MINRDASYTTQPLELLNALGFEKPKNLSVSIRDIEVSAGEVDNRHSGVSDNVTASPLASPSVAADNNEEMGLHLDGSEG